MNSKDLKSINFPAGKAFGKALAIETNLEPRKCLEILRKLAAKPEDFVNDSQFSEVARALLEEIKSRPIPMRSRHVPFQIYGQEGIESGALDQMYNAMRLPVAISGALMPDAHHGYGLPIGGVLATENAIIPYGVGVDIGCRMCLSVFDIPIDRLDIDKESLVKMLNNNTRFGNATFNKSMDDEIFERDEFLSISVVKEQKDRAFRQIGSSGGGNHFVEFGIVRMTESDNDLALEPGSYLGLLSHSGSRGMGANIARFYTQAAMANTKLPPEARHLAWLDMDTDLGREYWAAMNLAGDYASACHHQIHKRMAVGLRTKPIAMVENHHNFAWKELDANGKEVIVHRKGATPAGKGVLGVIPGSMTAPGYIVRGRGIADSINSASHGAGRVMSRTAAKRNLNKDEVIKHLNDHGVEVIGSGLDEAPMAYKNINEVMNSQHELVDILGSFTPKIVRMCGDKRFKEVD